MKHSEIEKEVDNSLKLLAKSSLIVFVGILLSKVFTYGYRIIIARFYGPEIYGVFTLSLMVTGLLITFSVLGMNNGLIRYISYFRGKGEQHKMVYVFRKTLKILLLTGMFSAFILFIFSDKISVGIFNEPRIGIFLRAFSLAIPAVVIGRSFLSTLRGFEKIGWYSGISNILENFTKLAVLVVLVVLGVGYYSIIISYLIGIAVTLTAAYIVCEKNISEIFSKEKLKMKLKNNIFKEFFSYSWPLMFFAIISSIFLWTDSFIIGIFESVASVGFYNIAIPIALLLTIPKDILMQLFFPLVTREYGDKNIDTVRRLSKQVGKWIFMITLPIFAFLILFPEVFISILFGKEYLVATNALRFLSIGAFSTSLFEFSKELISMSGKTKLILIDTVIFAIINLFLNIILVPRYGITGAAVATMCSLIMLNLTYTYQARKFLSLAYFKWDSIKILIIVIVPTAIIFALKPFIQLNISNMTALVFGFVLIYGFLIVKTKCLDKNDNMIISSIFKSMSIYKNKFIKFSKKYI